MLAGPFSVVITDLDGTLLRNDGSVSNSSVVAATELKRIGVPLIAATARTPLGVSSVASLAPLIDIAVCCTGALGWLPSLRSVLWTRFFATDTVRRIAEVLGRRFDHLGLASFDTHRWRMTEDYVGSRGAMPRGPTEVVPLSKVASSSPCAMAACVPGLEASHIAEELRAEGVSEREATLTWAAHELLDIVPPGIDKARGVGLALDHVGARWDQAVAFGDMPNDLPTLRSAAVAVTVADAQPELMLAADVKVSGLSDDGFARTLRELGIIG
jgi:HAD superfamily hydrolase (TIGR01484 family)